MNKYAEESAEQSVYDKITWFLENHDVSELLEIITDVLKNEDVCG